MLEGMIQRSPHFTNVLRGKTPTFEGWTEDPTDAANMTDGNLDTAMTTGYKTTTATYQSMKCTYDVPPGMYIVGLKGYLVSPSSNASLYFRCDAVLNDMYATNKHMRYSTPTFVAVQSSIGFFIEITSSDVTVSPHINEFYAVRLGDL